MTADPGGPPAPQEEPFGDIEAAVRATHDESVRTAYRILGSHADTEDAVQSAYVRVMLSWACVGSLPTAGDQRAYLRKVVRNEALQIIRRRQMRRECLGADGAASPLIPEHLDEYMQARRDLRLVWRAISGLPEGCREVVILYAAGYEYAEIATQLGMNVSTARSHISNARRQLRRAAPGEREGEPE